MKKIVIELTEAERRMIASLACYHMNLLHQQKVRDNRGYPGDMKKLQQIWKKVGGLTGKE